MGTTDEFEADRTTMTVAPEVKEIVDEHKREDETYNEFFIRVFADDDFHLTDDQMRLSELG